MSTSLNIVPSYSSTAITKVDEYIRYSKYGKLVIVDIGGVTAAKTGVVNNAIYNLPVFRTRPVASMFLDRGTERLGIYYGTIGSTSLIQNFYVANNTAKPAYGQIVYLTD